MRARRMGRFSGGFQVGSCALWHCALWRYDRVPTPPSPRLNCERHLDPLRELRVAAAPLPALLLRSPVVVQPLLQEVYRVLEPRGLCWGG